MSTPCGVRCRIRSLRRFAALTEAGASDWLHGREWRIRVLPQLAGLQVLPGGIAAILVEDPEWAPWREVAVRTGYLLDSDGYPAWTVWRRRSAANSSCRTCGRVCPGFSGTAPLGSPWIPRLSPGSLQARLRVQDFSPMAARYCRASFGPGVPACLGGCGEPPRGASASASVGTSVWACGSRRTDG